MRLKAGKYGICPAWFYGHTCKREIYILLHILMPGPQAIHDVHCSNLVNCRFTLVLLQNS